MSLSNHRKMEILGAVSRGPQSVRQMDGAVLLRYSGLLVSVAKSTGHVGIPFDPDTAAFIATLGVRERAQEAVERGEGIDPPRSLSDTPSRRKMAEGLEAMRRAMRPAS